MSTHVIHLHIDRVVVDGLPASAEHRFVHALRSGLTEMAETGMPSGRSGLNRRISSLDAGQMRPGASAEEAAGQVLHAIQQKIAGPGIVSPGNTSQGIASPAVVNPRVASACLASTEAKPHA